MLRTRIALSLALPLALLGGCGDDDGPGGTFRCTSDEGCDDAVACTVDTCGVDGTCRHTSVDERCGPGQRCDGTRGCAGMCMRNEDCDDAIDCTLDTCGVGGVCQATAVNERCPAGQTCSASTGCGSGMRPDAGMMSSTCTSSAQCDDGIECTIDSCGADMRCQHIGQNARCGAGETCNPLTGCARQCDPGGPASQCDDGVLCNGIERCDPEFGCSPAEVPEDCEDGDPCTINARCDGPSDTCLYECNRADASCADHPICREPPMEMFPGTFDIVPSLNSTCSPLAGAGFSISAFMFSTMGPILLIRGTPMERIGCTLAQSPVPGDGTIDAACEVTGECIESFSLVGSFTDRDHFTATFSANYRDAPGATLGCLGLCADQAITVTGTRRP